MTHQPGGNVTLQSFGYTYDTVVGRRKTMQVDGAGIDVYGYDAVDQVTSVKYNGSDANGTGASREVSYAHDAVGNRQSVAVTGAGDPTLPPLSAGTTAYATANPVNQYPNVGGQTHSYDANGNLIQAVLPPAAGGAILNYTYDAQNRLLASSGGGNSVGIGYDTRNRQVSRTVNGTVMYFVWDGWELIEERDNTGTLTASYVHGAGVDEILSRTDGTGTVYYHHDALGSVTALSEAAGQIVERYRYDIYGKAAILDAVGTPLAASAFGNRFLYTGREFITELALYDYRNRVYSAELGRFLQTDPIRFAAGDVNLYRYVGNGASNHRDPDGRFSMPLLVAAFAVVAVVTGVTVYNLNKSFNQANAAAEKSRSEAESVSEGGSVSADAYGAGTGDLLGALDSASAAIASTPHSFGNGPASLPGEAANSINAGSIYSIASSLLLSFA